MAELLLGWDAGASRKGIGFTRTQAEANEIAPRAPELICDGGEGHMMVFAPTGAGKSRGVVIPNLLNWRGPAIVIDLKGELTATTADYRRKVLGQKVYVLDPWGVTGRKSASLNPLDVLAMKGQEPADQALMLASMFSGGTVYRNDPFWTERGETLIAALLLAAHYPGHSLAWVSDMLTQGDTIYSLAELMDDKTLPSFAMQALTGVVSMADVTRMGILSTAQSLARFLLSSSVQQAFASSSFSLDAVSRGRPMTIYLVVPPAKLISQAPVLRLWLSVLMSAITERRKLPERPTLFVLDEVAQLGRMEQVHSLLTLGRGYGCRAMLIFHSYAQLTALYSDHATLMENAAAILTFGHNARSMSGAMAEHFGDVSTDALFAMRRSEIAIKRGGRETLIGKRLDYLGDALFKGRYKPNPMFEGRATGAA